MEIVQIIGIGLVSTIIMIILRKQKPEIAVLAGIAAGALMFLLIAAKLSAVVDLLEEYAARADIRPMYFSAVLKITGIAYIAEFGAEICRDAGEGAIAAKIELVGKVIIVTLAIPIITSLLDLVLKIMP
ncbi:MAG TPA: stage III sporulation protein AD [Clostridiales bacterium]|nr:stage III sporulation protein AD [Clostridiales bacterium]HOL90871.1 stage III sporulation protein AD [Clostridiales bacterium]HPP35205.1 stage III sporulation protein AD [Clostridiales bacterium]